ncbi:GerW family sporulation protein [Mucilaginibacter sp. BT774]|uniref:GerW family sporulation protein n=1 Tax=Mucilaginibacter sp. BT774 TaxID=3062276 RepID=UPI002674A862|nr:GerW family sporulation protein [Mucilaginibacter sp. BT774]MDO3627852.1 GerW family sporulation protein [Mucilaginibacter sp. BT774]
MENLDDMLGKLSDFLKSEAKTETIIGQQFQLGEFTCVPVMSVGLGLGSGGGEGKGKGKGPGDTKGAGEGEGFGALGAAGVGMGPVGFLVTRGETIEFIPARSSKGLSALLEKAPDIMGKIFDKTREKEAAHA